jgi:SAM-dependent methyltransferase
MGTVAGHCADETDGNNPRVASTAIAIRTRREGMARGLESEGSGSINDNGISVHAEAVTAGRAATAGVGMRAWSRWVDVVRTAVLLLLAMSSLQAGGEPEAPPQGDELYKPRLRQPGKDVMWLPTPEAMVLRMLQAARTTSKDLVYDLGAGDGRLAIAAARDFGARAVGIEYDASMAAFAERNAQRAGVGDKVKIIRGDIFKEDFAQASVVTLYLLPELNQQLRPRILKMKPGTRVVSYRWDMGEWEADDTIREGEEEAHLWIVPADVTGRWHVRDEHGFVDGDLDIAQRFQRIGGTISLRGRKQPLLGAYVRGDVLGFTFVHLDGCVRSARLKINGDLLEGSLRFADYLTTATGRRSR